MSERRIPALDGLRGAAVIGVLLFHDGRLSGGFLGVDLFFALSGFLITGLLLAERTGAGAIDLRHFWERRFRRLLPAVLVLLIAIVPMMAWLGTPGQLRDAREGALPALFYVYNWFAIHQGNSYWTLFADPSPLTHLWSLSVEEQFYLAWPLVFVLVARTRRWRANLAVVTAAGIVASAALMWLLFDAGDPNRAYMGTDTRASSVLCGALVAVLAVPDRLQRRPRVALVAVVQVAIVAGVAWAWLTVDGATDEGLARGGFVLHSLAAAVLAGTLATGWRTPVYRVLSIRPLRAAGAISYGWYLWHWPVYVVVDSTLARWTISLGLAIASYHLLEMPIRRRQRLARPRAATVALAGAALAVVAMVVLVPRPDTTPAAFDPGALGTTVPATQVPTTTPGAGVPSTTALPRRTVSSLMWSGDSVAMDSFPGMEAAWNAAGVEASFAGYYGTGLVPTDTIDTWKVFVQPVLDRRPDAVVFQFSFWDDRYDEATQRAAFDRYTDAVLGTGASLVFLQPPPNDPALADVPQAGVTMVGFARELAAERPGQVVVLDSSELWGTTYARDIQGDGVPDRKTDGIHLCPQGTAEMGVWLTAQLAGLFDGITPAAPSTWAAQPWVTSPIYDEPLGACA